MLLQPVNNIAEICARKGVTEAVVSPGSRCAPLTIAFARHPHINVRTVSDERAAAFIALGIALTKRQPVVLLCTSGTASLNYAPAVAEAYFQQVPLLVLTADRPPEWIDQLDGQTIRQQNIYGNHIKRSFDFPVDLSHHDAVWHTERMVNEALNEAAAFPPGPVHINVPLREPFYPEAGEEINYDLNLKIIDEEPNAFELTAKQQQHYEAELKRFSRVLVVSGHQQYEPELLAALMRFREQTDCVLVCDIISNGQDVPSAIRHQDVFLGASTPELLAQLQPDLLITFGLSVISKNMKTFLRAAKPQEHWHLQPAGAVADTFKALTRIVRVEPAAFFNSFPQTGRISDKAFSDTWRSLNTTAETFLNSFFAVAPFNEFTATERVLRKLPAHSQLHLANSMAVRYANLLGLQPEQGIEVFANRGTSGIDGSTSTAVGSALAAPEKITTLFTGDLAFFYDRNGLWHNYLPPNLRVVLLNNHAGGIFRLIEGPRSQPELEEFFETRQQLNAENTARDFGLRYLHCTSQQELEDALPEFFAPHAGAAILEITTDSATNAAFFKAFKDAFRQFIS